MRQKKEDEKGRLAIIGIVFLIAFCATVSATPGNVHYYDNLTNDSNSIDYLIISHDDFYLNVDLYRLAAWRAENNSFDVGIVNTSDIYAQFPESANDTSIKAFIQYVYENWTKKERVNNDIFVLLVGDAAAAGEYDYMPLHESDLVDNNGDNFGTDNWYADVNGSDRDPDIYLGRFSAKNNENVSSIANKTIDYENTLAPANQWHKKVLFINAADGSNPTFLSNINDSYNNMKSTSNPFSYSYLDLVTSILSTNPEATANIQGNISDGYWVTNYFGGGGYGGWVYSAGDGFSCAHVPTLNNFNNLTVILSFGCSTAFINSSSGDALAECATREPGKGAVGFLGGYSVVTAGASYVLEEWLFEQIFINNTHTWGEAIALTKRRMGQGGTGRTTPLDLYNWIGDPALGIKDYRPPDVENVTVSARGTQATIYWDLDEPGNATLSYGTSEGLPNSTGTAELLTSHNFTLTKLTPNTVYYFNITTCDALHNCNTSGEHSLTTNNLGSVYYYDDLDDASNTADYLIIANELLYDNVDLYRLAAWRAENNSFDVGIVNTSDIYSFYTAASNDTSIKAFIKDVYENWTKKERTDNDIFVLLVGDHAASGEYDFVPAHESDLLDDSGGEFATDNWYADVNGSDRDPDIYLGRFSVKNNENVSSMANKTVDYENSLPITGWNKKIIFINAADASNPTFRSNINDSYNNMKTSAKPYDLGYLDIVTSLFGSQSEVTSNIQGNISDGYWITTYHGGSVNSNWGYFGESGFGCNHIPSLANNDNLTVILSFGCSTAAINASTDVFAECATREADKGAVGFLGAYSVVTSGASYVLAEWLVEQIFINNTQTWGEAIALTKRRMGQGGTGHTTPLDLYNWIGDPALGIKDYRPPETSIVRPGNSTTDSNILEFSAVDPHNDSCWYSTGGGGVNTSLSDCSNSTFTLADGSYTLTLWANDTLGNENSTSVDFVYDTEEPNITLSNPLNFDVYNSSNVSFSYNVTDLSDVHNCTLIINGSNNETSTSITKDSDQHFNISLYNDAYSWSVNCSDTLGHVNNSDTWDVVVNCTESWTCTSWSSCSNSQQARTCTDLNDCLAQADKPSESQSCTETPTGGGSSGGSSSSTTTTTGNTETVIFVTGGKEGETKTAEFKKDISVTGISLTLAQKVDRIEITAQKLNTKPEQTSYPAGNVYSYLKIDKNLADKEVSKAMINFKVAQTWLAGKGHLPEEISLKRYENTWTTLPTTLTKTDAENAYYEAQTPSFSYFAITAEKKEQPPKEPETPTEETQEKEPEEETATSPEPESSTKFPKQAWYSLGLILIALAIGLLIKKLPKNWKRSERKLPGFEQIIKTPEIVSFCTEKLTQGYNEKQIIDSAKKAGWEEEKIKQILKELKKSKR